jgi:RND family efflux transporter MFP subunit
LHALNETLTRKKAVIISTVHQPCEAFMRRSNIPRFVASAACAVLALSACKPSETAGDPRNKAWLVRITTVQPASQATQGFTGVVAAKVESNLGFRVPGKVVERLVDTGQTVHAGQTLMRIDPTDLAHAVTAQAGNVAAAKARALQTASDEARYRGLVATGAASKSVYEEARAAADSARALLSAAQAQARMAEDEAVYAVLLADADGTVTATLAEPGQVVTAGQTVIRLAHDGAREAIVDLPETLRPALGSSAEARLYARDGVQGRAVLRQLSNAADPRTRTYEARYVLDGEMASAPLGATVTLRLATRPQDDEAEVPLSALGDEGKGAGVWIIDPATSTVAFRPVQVRRIGAETAILDGGVRPGETIVALGGHLLHAGQRVEVASRQASAQ